LADAEDDIVELDVRETGFVDPLGMTLLGESLLQLADYGQRVRVIGLDQQTGVYLHRMDVFGTSNWWAAIRHPDDAVIVGMLCRS